MNTNLSDLRFSTKPTKSDLEVWLVQVPIELKDKISSLAASSTEPQTIGSLSVTPGSNKVLMKFDAKRSSSIESSFILSKRPPKHRNIVVETDKGDGSVRRYRFFGEFSGFGAVRSFTDQKVRPRTGVKIQESISRTIHLAAGMKELSSKQSMPSIKRYSMESSELRERIITLFRENKYLTFETINQSLNQPEKTLRDALKEVAIRHAGGELTGHWELKEEYY